MGRAALSPRPLSAAALLLLVAGIVSAVLVQGEAGAPRRYGEPYVPPPLPAPAATRPVPVARSEVVVAPDARTARTIVERLVALGPRPAGTDTDPRAREVIATALRSHGWTVVEEEVALRRGTSANLVAWLGGDDPRGHPHVVIGAHHDTVPGSPGGNDNGSGVGVLIALAENLRTSPPEVPTVLVAFGAEEHQPDRSHHHGSRLYASTHADRVTAMLSVDMTGHGASTCICFTGPLSRQLSVRLSDLAVERDIGPFHSRAIGAVSDHAPFVDRGVPAVLVWTELEPRYHSPRDGADHVGLDELRRAGDLIATFLRSGP